MYCANKEERTIRKLNDFPLRGNCLGGITSLFKIKSLPKALMEAAKIHTLYYVVFKPYALKLRPLLWVQKRRNVQHLYKKFYYCY